MDAARTTLEQSGFISVGFQSRGRELVIKARRNRRDYEETAGDMSELREALERLKRTRMRPEQWTEGFNG